MDEHVSRILNEIECVVLEATMSATNRIIAASLGISSEDCTQGSEEISSTFENKIECLLGELQQHENNV